MLDVLELLGGGSGLDLRASIVLTYSLDLPLYDGLVRRTLARAGILNQAIFCDLTPYNLETHSQAATQHLGTYYSVTPLWQTGSFHPKVYLLLGPRHGRMLIGSGNATSGGLLRNAEVFGLFEFDKAKDPGPHPAFAPRSLISYRTTLRPRPPKRSQATSARAPDRPLAGLVCDPG
jgi:hypothetical protein